MLAPYVGWLSSIINGGCDVWRSMGLLQRLSLLQLESSTRLPQTERLPKEENGAVDAVLRGDAKGRFVQGPWNDRIYPSVKVLHHNGWDCPAHQTWEFAQTAGGKMHEVLQETGFVRFFQGGFYPHVEHWSLEDTEASGAVGKAFHRNNASILPPHDDSLLFIPACFFTNNSLPVPFNATLMPENKGYYKVPTTSDVEGMLKFQTDRPPFRFNKQVFWIVPHPLMRPKWNNPLMNARGLRIDDSVTYAIGDVIIPISVELQHCPIHLPIGDDDDDNADATDDRSRLLFGCGRDHSQRFPQWRHDLFEALDQLNRTDVFAATEMTLDDYQRGFFTSKFCLVVPGDTVSTSQATRALCGGCIPIFVVDDPRTLPFADILDYRSFSLRKTMDQILLGYNQGDQVTIIRHEGMQHLLRELEQIVVNGTYQVLRNNLNQARDFFNYHRFDQRSPYAMALVAIALDQRHLSRSRAKY